MGDVKGGHVVAVVGLKREAAVLRGLDVAALAGGGDEDRLARHLTGAAAGADGIISFGMAGALAPDLHIGDWVIGERVGEFECDERWIAVLAGLLPGARIGPVHADGRLIGESAGKLNLNRTSGCLAADMESHVAAAAARRAGVPFAVLRCVSDEAAATLPPAVAVAMRPGGGLALGAVLRSLLMQPAQVRALGRTVRGFNQAYATLRAGAQRVGPRLAFDQR